MRYLNCPKSERTNISASLMTVQGGKTFSLMSPSSASQNPLIVFVVVVLGSIEG